jgi:hypothetical protein
MIKKIFETWFCVTPRKDQRYVVSSTDACTAWGFSHNTDSLRTPQRDKADESGDCDVGCLCRWQSLKWAPE